jgi:hypothetical protein
METVWKITDFATLQKFYTGASNKRKWVIVNVELLRNYFELCGYKPGILKDRLNTSYSSVKRLLCSANLWYLAIVRTQTKGGRNRTATQDKFGYKYSDSSNDIINDRGEVIRIPEHRVVAEKKYGRKLRDKEIVHHIDLNKQNNDPDNIFICEDNGHHRRLHGLLERIAGEAVRAGIIKFHPDHGYYLDNKEAIIES